MRASRESGLLKAVILLLGLFFLEFGSKNPEATIYITASVLINVIGAP